jgi:penicillin-binding protein 2
VANKGYYYTPHFVKSIEGDAEDDTLLSRFHIKHEPLSHITDAAYDVVQDGMEDVVDFGTGKGAKIPGITMCGKTGTAETKRVLDGRVIKLRSHSWFVCFAPRDHPRIAVAVIVENAGYGAAQAGPIASLMIEKYLNDTIATDRLALEDEITNRNLQPRYLIRLQFKADSIRAADWATQSGDSTRWLKYQTPSFRYMMLDTSDGSRSPLMLNLLKPAPYKSALAERLAKERARAAAATIGLDSAMKAAASGDSGRHVPVPRVKRDSSRTPKGGAGNSGGAPPAALPSQRPANTDSSKAKDSTP